MNRIIIVLVLAATCSISSAQNINLDSMFTAEMADTHTPGVSALILKKGIPVWQHNYGWARIEDSIPVTENTSFMLASISKTFISVAIMKMVEEGFIDLNAPVGNYLSFTCSPSRQSGV